MAGIKETKDVLIFSIGLGVAVDKALADGYSWDDLFALIPSFIKLPEALDGANEILNELEDLDDQEKAELVAVVEELDLASDKTEEIVEQSLVAFIEIAHLIMLVRAAKKEE